MRISNIVPIKEAVYSSAACMRGYKGVYDRIIVAPFENFTLALMLPQKKNTCLKMSAFIRT